eukprot:NODE_404_length_8016_cov_1.092965.p3 type:complete len:393 gc:universal NODE_404_length_8016_cov_1.092965:443-1621(+)
MENLQQCVEVANTESQVSSALDQIQTLSSIRQIEYLKLLIDCLLSKKLYNFCAVVYIELVNLDPSSTNWIEYLHFLKNHGNLNDFKKAFELGYELCEDSAYLIDVYRRGLHQFNDVEAIDQLKMFNVKPDKKRKRDESTNENVISIDRQSDINRTIIVKNYNLKENHDSFRKYFEQYGDIVKLTRHDDETIFIQFLRLESVGRVRETKHNLDGIDIYIQIPHAARDRTLYVSGLPSNVVEAEISQYLSQFGQVEEIRLKTNFETQSSFAYVDMFSPDQAKKSAFKNKFDLRGHSIHITLSDPKKARNKNQIHTDKERSCCIKNLPFWLNESNKESLEKLLLPFGKILEVRFLRSHKGMVFVEFSDTEEAQALLNYMQDLKLGGRLLKIEKVN